MMALNILKSEFLIFLPIFVNYTNFFFKEILTTDLQPFRIVHQQIQTKTCLRNSLTSETSQKLSELPLIKG